MMNSWILNSKDILFLGFLEMSCPTFNSSYSLINGSCYYFEAQSLNYENAQTNCDGKFGIGIQSGLFEPRNMHTNQLVAAEAQNIDQTYL